MRWEIEPSGCCERNGMHQIRLCFYLAPGDARYQEHHVKLPVIPEEGYPGELDEQGQPKSDDDFDAWHDDLPRRWQTNPFHNHFIRVPLNTTDEEIAAQAEALLPHFYGKWKCRERLGVTDGPH